MLKDTIWCKIFSFAGEDLHSESGFQISLTGNGLTLNIDVIKKNILQDCAASSMSPQSKQFRVPKKYFFCLKGHPKIKLVHETIDSFSYDLIVHNVSWQLIVSVTKLITVLV